MPGQTTLPVAVRAALPAGSGLAMRQTLQRAGATHADLESWCSAGVVERVTRGAYGEPLVGTRGEEQHLRLVRAVLLARDDREMVVTGPSALVVHGFPLLGAPPTVVHALGPHAHGRRAVDRVRIVGPAEPDEYQQHGPWYLATPARAVLDCARVFGVAAALAAADVALRGGRTTDD